MMTAIGSIGAGRGWTPRPSSFAGMGNQALLNTFINEFRKQQAKSCERDVDEVRRSGMSDKWTGEKKERETGERFIF